jgi:DNA-binding transcriptional regulator YdaS (Cro superfamily)
MTPKQLKALGKKLGEGWQTKLARLLPCTSRTVRRWASGESEISPMVAERIKQVVKEQTDENR